MKIKFCGLRRKEDIEFANELMPDYIGFVFVEKSKRYVTHEQAHILRNSLSKNIYSVGVFVDSDIDSITKLCEDKTIDIVQLHGDEDESYISKLRSKINAPIIKAFCIDSHSNTDIINGCTADYILLDGAIAGSGNCFDWSITKKITKPYFLAGGLNCDNILQAIEQSNPFAVDVSSGIETDGVKDIAKMKDFLDKVRKAEK